MRYIDLNNLDYERARQALDWDNKATTHTNAIRPLNSEERSQYLDSHAIWRELKPAMEMLSNGKCWYSEAQQFTDKFSVDHFRPKNRAISHEKEYRKGKKPIQLVLRENGYWWLSYDWKNYRLAGDLVNTRSMDELTEKVLGKGTFFPLYLQDAGVAVGEQSSDNCDNCEKVLLLDPTKENDVRLITFDKNGEIVTNDESFSPYDTLRVSISVEYLALNAKALKDARAESWNLCQSWINVAQHSARIKDIVNYREALANLQKMIHANAQFRCCLKFNIAAKSSISTVLQTLLDTTPK